MAKQRKILYNYIINRKFEEIDCKTLKESDFRSNALSFSQILENIDSRIAEEIRKRKEKNSNIKKEHADLIAEEMKRWALKKNIRHYTHWFQPLSGVTAEKNDNFINYCVITKRKFDKFDGSKLILQETDGSSFPHGGLRNTFEARGYTVWDSDSPAFIFNNSLCIPTILISYKREAMDFKLSLKRSSNSLNIEANKLFKTIGHDIKGITSLLGWEQEFFVIDTTAQKNRADLNYVGRTVIGRSITKNQKISYHYFGKIPLRVLNFMKEVEFEAYKLGIPIKTRHSENAINQFEFAYLFDDVNISVDHNSLFNNLMENVAKKHSLSVLFHEKPFKNMCGSGKHANWSIITDKGENIFELNKQNSEIFLIFLSCILKALYDYGDLLTASVSTYSNDFRLGGFEAPPNILSVYIGKSILDFVENQLSEDILEISPKNQQNDTYFADENDRNRTSPFAFIGNRFEYRAVGSSNSCSMSVSVLQTILSKTLCDFNEKVCALINGQNLKSEVAVKTVIKEFLKASKNIIFNGNGYSNEWKEEAIRRKLFIPKHAADAYNILSLEKNVELFEYFNILKKPEILARAEILYEKYVENVLLEEKIVSNMVFNEIIPSIEKRILDLFNLNEKLCKISEEDNVLVDEIKELNEICNKFKDLRKVCGDHILKSNAIKTIGGKANYLGDNLVSHLNEFRKLADKAEFLLPDELWPIMKYDEVLTL